LSEVKKAGKRRHYPMSQANSYGNKYLHEGFWCYGGQEGLMGARISYIQRRSRSLLPSCDIIVQIMQNEELN